MRRRPRAEMWMLGRCSSRGPPNNSVSHSDGGALPQSSTNPHPEVKLLPVGVSRSPKNRSRLELHDHPVAQLCPPATPYPAPSRSGRRSPWQSTGAFPGLQPLSCLLLLVVGELWLAAELHSLGLGSRPAVVRPLDDALALVLGHGAGRLHRFVPRPPRQQSLPDSLTSFGRLRARAQSTMVPASPISHRLRHAVPLRVLAPQGFFSRMPVASFDFHP
jgi:hypothetical protein